MACVYEARTESAYCKLDQRHFEAAGVDRGFLGGSLDAPERMPGGSVMDRGRKVPWVCASLVSRPDLVAYHAALELLAEKLVAAVLASD